MRAPTPYHRPTDPPTPPHLATSTAPAPPTRRGGWNRQLIPLLPRFITAGLLAVGSHGVSHAQLVYYEFDDSLQSSDSSATSTASLVSLIGLSNPLYAQGPAGGAPPSLYLAASVMSSLNLSQYLEFTVTAAPGRHLDLQSLFFDAAARVQGNYSANWELRSSVDGFATRLGTGRVTATTWAAAVVDLSAADHTSLNSVTFRLYLGDSSNGTKDGLYLDNLRLEGISAVPEPHAWGWVVAGSLAAFAVYRRNRRERAV